MLKPSPKVKISRRSGVPSAESGRAVGACSVEARHGSPPGGRVPATGRCAPRDLPRAREVRSGRRRLDVDRLTGQVPDARLTATRLEPQTNSQTDLYNRTTPGVVWPTSGFYDLNRDASRGSAVRTPRGLIAIAARVAHMRYVTHDVMSGSDKR